jgi:hypothetical protein
MRAVLFPLVLALAACGPITITVANPPRPSASPTPLPSTTAVPSAVPTSKPSAAPTPRATATSTVPPTPPGASGPPAPNHQPLSQAGAAATFGKPPWAVAAAPDGKVYVADNFGNQVVQVTSTGTVVPVAGTGKDGTGDVGGQVAVEAVIRQPTGLAIDSQGRLLILEHGTSTGYPRVLRLEPDGRLSLVYNLPSDDDWVRNHLAVGLVAGGGDQILFTTWDTANAKAGSNDVADYSLWEVPAEGQAPKLLHSDTQTDLLLAGVDGQGRLYYQRQNGASAKVIRIDPATGERVPLVDERSGLSWCSVDQRGNIVFSRGGGEVSVWLPGGEAWTLATQFSGVNPGVSQNNRFAGVAPDGTAYVASYMSAALFPHAIPADKLAARATAPIPEFK